MKTEKNILIAFLLNLAFSVFEFVGGCLTGSVAIVSDSVHDLGDAVSIGVSYFLEKKSHRPPDEEYTYGYVRYSVVGSAITIMILLMGSVMVVCNAVNRIITPKALHYDGMILFAVVGVVINLLAAFVTSGGKSMNQQAVNLHMLEDVLCWAMVLIGAMVMRVTDFVLLDPILSIGVAVYIFIHAFKHMKEVLDIFLEKKPKGIKAGEIKEKLLSLEGVEDVRHLHIWSLDGQQHCATLHIVTQAPDEELKEKVRRLLREQDIGHVTVEFDSEEQEREHCHLEVKTCSGHHHH